MNESLIIGIVLLLVCGGVGFVLGAALHRRLFVTQLADLEGDIAALKQGGAGPAAKPEGAGE
ncbi:MAG: hypothetical protein AB7M12_07120 [Hyphomonadaceae bacterium]